MVESNLPSVAVREGEWPLFSALPQREKLAALAYERMCNVIDAAPNRRLAIREIADRHAGMPGMSESSVRNRYYYWLANNRNLFALARTTAVKRDTLAKRLAQHYKAGAERNQRSSRAAYDQLMRDIRAGHTLPGVGDWRAMWSETHPELPAPADCPADFTPAGLTYRNMQRVAGLSRYERAAARRGAKAALAHAPSVYSTRVGLEVGQVYMWDDLTHDVIVDDGNSVRSVRPQEFACLDVASAYKCAWAVKAERILEDGKRERLREREMRYLVAWVLTGVGYRAAGSTWFVEHGTAAIREDLRKIIYSLTRDAIRILTSGILGDQVHGGMWPGKGEGVPGLKAHLESSFNLVHNVTAALPGQTGSNSRETKPEQLHGLVKYHADLVQAAASLPEETKRRLMLPIMRMGEFSDALSALYRIIHDRREHALEGWDQCGNVAHCFRLSPAMPWAPIAATLESIADPQKRAAMDAAIATIAERRMVRATSGEVWRRGAGKLTRLEHWATVALLADDERCVRRARLSRKGELSFQDAYYGPGTHRFWPVLSTPDGRRELLRDRRDYALILTPYDPGRIYVCEPAGMSCLGVCERMVPGSRIDMETMGPLMGRRQEIVGMLNEPIQERHAEDAAARAALIAHNDAVLAEAGVGPRAVAPAAAKDDGDEDGWDALRQSVGDP
jgi:hypothetical protein